MGGGGGQPARGGVRFAAACSLTSPLPLPFQVIIEGFKSYKDQTVSDSFSPGVNVVGELNGRAGEGGGVPRSLAVSRTSHAVLLTPPLLPPPPFPSPSVGANGSGKSNFFGGKRER